MRRKSGSGVKVRIAHPILIEKDSFWVLRDEQRRLCFVDNYIGMSGSESEDVEHRWGSPAE